MLTTAESPIAPASASKRPISVAESLPVHAVTDHHTLHQVRPVVRELLQASPAFRSLSIDEQRELAGEMVKVSSYLANPDGLAREAIDNGEVTPQVDGPLAAAQADDATEELRQRLADDSGFAGEDFEAGAVQAGTQAFGDLVQSVDFPTFVSGLIRGVFEAIVDSSIDQMRAYGELLANVAKSIDQFAEDNITKNNARDWLTDQFPDTLQLEEQGFSSGFADGDDTDGETTPEPQPKLAVREDAPDGALELIRDYFGLQNPPDLSEPTSEAELVRRAQLEIARGRQQLLSSMIVLGINRIVVTDGLINAKVIFDMKARDTATRTRKASMYDREQSATSAGVSAGYSSWFSPYKASAYANTSKQHVATVQTSVDETSDSRAEVKARLSGEVRVNFKSDNFPMDKLATPEMMAAIQGNAQPTGPPVPGA